MDDWLEAEGERVLAAEREAAETAAIINAADQMAPLAMAVKTGDDADNASPGDESQTDARHSPGFIARQILGRDRRRARKEPPRETLKGRAERIAGEFQRLRKWAEENGLIFDPSRLGEERDSRGEHRVYAPVAAADAGRVFKLTHPNHAGMTRTALKLKDGGIRVMEDDATPAEYLDRWDLHNVMMGDAARFEGIHESATGPAIVISQPHIDGSLPELAAVVATLRANGWDITGDGSWQKTGPDGLVVGLADVKDSNWMQDKTTHVVLSIDSIPFIATEAMLQKWGLPLPAAQKTERPAWLQVEQSAFDGKLTPDELRAAADSFRDPRNALALVRGQVPGRDQTARESGSPGDGSEMGRPGGGTGSHPQSPRGIEALPSLDATAFVQGIAGIDAPEDRQTGAEHLVYRDRATERAIKLTQPGQFGARGSLESYLGQMIEFNARFADAIAIEGRITLPGETQPRLVTSQPWIDGRESTYPEIETYLRRRGFLRMYDGAWWHPDAELQITDALPKNFRTDPNGYVHPIDLIIAWPAPSQLERIEDIVAGQPQPPPLPEPPPLPAATKTDTAADLREQAAFLERAARGMKFADADTLALERPDLLARLAVRWRATHPRSSAGNFVQNAAKRAIDVLLYGRDQAARIEASSGNAEGTRTTRLQSLASHLGAMAGTGSRAAPPGPRGRSPTGPGSGSAGSRQKPLIVDWAREHGLPIHDVPARLERGGPNDLGLNTAEHHVFTADKTDSTDAGRRA